MKNYNQLNLGQRYQIECLLELGYNQTEISEVLDYNEQSYQKKSNLRPKIMAKSKRLTANMLSKIRDQLKNQRWSPELISEKGKEEYGDFVSAETIYQYIWKCKKSNKKRYAEDNDLHRYLRHVRDIQNDQRLSKTGVKFRIGHQCFNL